MSKKSNAEKEKSGHERTITNVLLITAITELLIKLIELIEKLIE